MRKNFFVKPQLQIRNLIFSLAVTLAGCVLVYLFLNYMIWTSARFLNVPMETLQSFRSIFHLTFAGILFSLLIAFGFESYFRFHRIAGPVFVMEKMVHSFAAGDFSQGSRNLRKKDEFKDLMSELQVMRDGIKTIVLEDRKILKDISDRLAQLASFAQENFENPSMRQEISSIRKDLELVTSRYKV